MPATFTKYLSLRWQARLHARREKREYACRVLQCGATRWRSINGFFSEEMLKRVSSRSSDISQTEDAQSKASERDDYSNRGFVHCCTYATEKVTDIDHAYLFTKIKRKHIKTSKTIITSKPHIPWTLHACLMKTSSKTTCMCVSFRTAYAQDSHTDDIQ